LLVFFQQLNSFLIGCQRQGKLTARHIYPCRKAVQTARQQTLFSCCPAQLDGAV